MHPTVRKKLDSVREYFLIKAGALRRQNGKYLQRQETRLERSVSRRLKGQMQWTVDGMETLSFFEESKGVILRQRKDTANEIDDFVNGMPGHEDIADDLVGTSGPVFKKGAGESYSKLKMSQIGIAFDAVNPRAVDYLKKLKTLHLSDYRGSIKRETEKRIIQILTDAAQEGQSYTEAAKKIREQGKAGVFSRSRAELIAVNQVGRAYGTGGDEMIQEYKEETGASVEKYWQTVDDANVTEECKDNQDEGWIGYEAGFPSGDEFAPRQSNPRCRCVTSYRTVTP